MFVGILLYQPPDEESAQQIFYDDTMGNLNPSVDTADDFEIDDIYVEDNPIEEN